MRKFNRLFFDDFFSPNVLLRNSIHKEEAVHSQIDEEDDAWYIRLALPGLNNKSISLALEEGVLVVQHEKDDQQEEANNGFATSFTKRFKLNKDIDLDKVKAQMNHGLLTITLPKKKVNKSERKEIPIAG
ncbi:MAG: Hsp20/alpha crystallin family protein [Chitinophagales bacterium]